VPELPVPELPVPGVLAAGRSGPLSLPEPELSGTGLLAPEGRGGPAGRGADGRGAPVGREPALGAGVRGAPPAEPELAGRGELPA
jgi:hypothetical protein